MNDTITYLLVEQGITFLITWDGFGWRKAVSPRPTPSFTPMPTNVYLAYMNRLPPTRLPPTQERENTMINAKSVNLDDTAAYTADLRKEQARDAVDALVAATWGPGIDTVIAWIPTSIRSLAVVSALRFLANHKGLLVVARLTPKQIAAVEALADDAFTAVAAPLIGGWLRKSGPVLKKALGIYDPTSIEKMEASGKQLVNLLAKAMKQAAESGSDASNDDEKNDENNDDKG